MKIIKWLNDNLEEFIMVILLMAMTIIMGIQICARYIFNYSLTWSEEITRYLFIWSAFISLSYCTRKCISIKIEQILAAFSKRKKAFAKLINHTIELIFFCYLIPYAYRYLITSIVSGQLSPACRLPMYVIQAAPFMCFLLVIIRVLQRWIIELNVVRRG
ncbi:MAG: TRAP transporter small permease [Lachnotalea sp.]